MLTSQNKAWIFSCISVIGMYCFFAAYLIGFVVRIRVRSMETCFRSVLKRRDGPVRLQQVFNKWGISTYRIRCSDNSARSIRLIQERALARIILIRHAGRGVQRSRASCLGQVRAAAFRFSLVLRDQHNAEAAALENWMRRAVSLDYLLGGWRPEIKTSDVHPVAVMTVRFLI